MVRHESATERIILDVAAITVLNRPWCCIVPDFSKVLFLHTDQPGFICSKFARAPGPPGSHATA